MRKIHPGFIALAVLLGPATLIRGHQVVSDSRSQRSAQDPDPYRVAQRIYQKCSELPRVQRTVQCDQYVTWFEGCLTSKNTCDPPSAYTRLIDLKFFDQPGG
jgi:hypothetical protein